MSQNAENLEPHILENYKIIQRLGKGAYGVVWKAVDNRTGEKVAIKKVKFMRFQVSKMNISN